MASIRVFLLACFAGIITIERTIEAGYCSRSHTCSAQGYRSTRYTTRCGAWISWKRCERYRAVGYTYYKTCYTYYCCPGYTGTTCSQPICSGSTSCPNGGTCIRPNQCSCRPGFSGSHCTDNNECQLGTHNCDQLCANTIGTFRCSCNPGYTLQSNRKTCTDNNECQLGTHNCDQLCTNTIGTFRCSCNPGYTLQSNKRTCTDNNECLNNNGGCSQYCRNLDGSYECYCKDGLHLDIDGKSCIDTDECSSNNSDCEHLCMNEHAAYRCECYQGHQLEPDGKSCIDINDCIGIQCSNGGSCIDLTESYSYIDECLYMNGDCEDQCFNTNGSYYCQCRDNGFLESNGSSCKGQYLTSPTTSDQSGLLTSGIAGLIIGLLSIIVAVSFVVYRRFRLQKRKPVRNNDYTEFNTCNPSPVVTDQYDILNTTNMGTNDDNENQTDRNIHTYEECQPSNNTDRTCQNQNIQSKVETYWSSENIMELDCHRYNVTDVDISTVSYNKKRTYDWKMEYKSRHYKC